VTDGAEACLEESVKRREVSVEKGKNKRKKMSIEHRDWSLIINSPLYALRSTSTSTSTSASTSARLRE